MKLRFLLLFCHIFGVISPHPIFSTTHNDWRLAGELEVGEKVLTYHACLPNGMGEATVNKTEKKAMTERSPKE